MTDDILAVMWKELKGLFRYRGSRARFALTLMSPVFLAIVVPWNEGKAWLDGFLSLLVAAIVPVILVGITIPESFAGERERHTLETLLASRLPDRAILFGKFAVSVALAMGVTLASLLVSAVVVNIRYWDGEILMYAPRVILADLALSFVLTTLCAGAGVIISQRSATVQEATQTLMAVFLVPPMILQALSFMFMPQISDFVEDLNLMQVFLIIVAVLALIDLLVFMAAMARFQRSRLVLD